ncbi:DUF1493 family protein [Paracidovorax valerianellae]|uniref:DUF1493 domain-containing protein n=1 Tax=Paracidovorax valerianellae TaxID=187868 RepID=A0A1G6RCB1_9BURK|nr:DUF1493 family protein [Paracidovorax valerianellae]MDA8445061.1 DUF1493 family protein [Paracidovorax valerianellae]SDD01546.1 Protein of unknown function [Paracidovorax valerianellae]
MVIATSELWKDLVQLASTVDTVGLRQLGKKIDYTPDTDLVKDMGLTGDDAFQFMETFASKFNVDKGDYRSSDYFGSEGLWLLSIFKKPAPTLPITLGMLFIAAREGNWDAQRLQKAHETRKYF